MTTATAKLLNYRQAPRKVRLVANLVKGKTVPMALRELSVLPKRATPAFIKLINSAAANAKVAGMTGDLTVKELRVDKGAVQKRMMPRAHGRGFPIHKHTSHIVVVLTGESSVPALESGEKTTKASAKKTVAKKTVAKKTTTKKSA